MVSPSMTISTSAPALIVMASSDVPVGVGGDVESFAKALGSIARIRMNRTMNRTGVTGCPCLAASDAALR